VKDKKIVIIDDCRLTLAVAKDMLEAEGFVVATAESSVAANPHIFASEPPALIMVDVEMPLFNGEKTVQHLRSRPKCKDIRLMMISAKSQEELAGIAKKTGADAFACKPFDPKSLIPQIKTLVTF
jgi:DNA-binding response OmpR family regulator